MRETLAVGTMGYPFLAWCGVCDSRCALTFLGEATMGSKDTDSTGLFIEAVSIKFKQKFKNLTMNSKVEASKILQGKNTYPGNSYRSSCVAIGYTLAQPLLPAPSWKTGSCKLEPVVVNSNHGGKREIKE